MVINMKKDVLRFAAKCICIPAVAVLIIFLLNIPYREIDDAKYMDLWNLRMLGNQINDVKIANIGSSHGAYDFVYDELQEEGYSCFNFGNVSQTYNYDYAMLKEYGKYIDEGSLLFIPVSYFSFNNEVVNDTEAQALSVKYYHCLSPENMPDYDLFTDIVTTKLPILSAGEDILKLLPDFKLSIVAFAADDGIDAEEFARRAQDRYDRHFNNKDEYFMPERIEELYTIIDYCREHDITPVLITTPFSKYYRDLVSKDFLKEFNETVTKIADDTGVNYYDYSYDPRFRGNLDYFSDSDHLNEEGAAYFMEILEEEVPEFCNILN
jgi:hypothetical protein